jgi:predicted sulfurtransferase
MAMSLNPGMEQDFRDTIKRCNEMVLLAREGINEAINGNKAGITITLQQMKEKAEAISDTISCDQDTLDTFTEFSEA